MRIQGTALAFCVLFGSIGIAEAASPDRSGSPSLRSRQHVSTGPSNLARPRSAVAQPQAARRHGQRLAAAQPGRGVALDRQRRSRFAASGAPSGGLSCVPYVRMVTGMQVSGNGGDWWHNASGTYARGQRPEPGAVITFRSSGGMSRGHVAVVDRVLSPRHILIDHANWAGPGIRRGTVMQDVHVIDVSEDNDWTAVRVQVGHDAGAFGRTYLTYGFIYNRPDSDGGTLFAGTPLRRTSWQEVAEAPALMPSAMAMTPQDPARRGARRR